MKLQEESEETTVGDKDRMPKDGPLWHEDYCELKNLCGWGGATEAGKQEARMQVAVLTVDTQDCGAEGTPGEKKEEDSLNWGFLL